MLLENMLNRTGLYLEEIPQQPGAGITIDRHGRVADSSKVISRSTTNPYFGFNVSQIEGEPIDQIVAFLAADRIQTNNGYRWGGKRGNFVALIAGGYEILNEPEDQVDDKHREMQKKDREKSKLFRAIGDAFDLKNEVLTTASLWHDTEYWDVVGELLMQPQFTRDALTADTLDILGSNNKSKIDNSVLAGKLIESNMLPIPKDVASKVEDWPSSILYTPIEVAEAVYLASVFGINMKLGPASERTYDKYILPYMDIGHLKQSVDLQSSRFSPFSVTPYIARMDKPGRRSELRILFEDDQETIAEKLKGANDSEVYTLTVSREAGSVLHPIVEKTIYAVEAGVALDMHPETIGGRELHDGISVIEFANSAANLKKLKQALPELVTHRINAPIKQRLNHG